MTVLVDLAALLLRAEEIARRAHAGVPDKSGRPYIEHSQRVAGRVHSHEEKIVAWLHDVVEDTDITLEDLANEFPPAIVEAVDAITHRSVSPKKMSALNETRHDYYLRVLANPVARIVKLADISDNTDPRRLLHLPIGDAVRMMQKYAGALDVLVGKLT
jgi:(p)ppGpp synthase/HD superfamily hydrolase